MTETPKPCPYCGGTDIAFQQRGCCWYEDFSGFECQSCKALGPQVHQLWALTDDAEKVSEALALWNRRHD